MAREVITHRRQTETQVGFTIVELLIVVVVIAILAAITIVSYNGITARAIETTMKSDLQGAASILEIDSTNNGTYPLSALAANNGLGLKSSGDNTLSYSPKSYGYCVTVSNSRISTPLRIRSDTRLIQNGICDVIVSTFAGSGSSGYTNATGAAAQFSSPRGLAADASGTVYIADSNNNAIRKISPSGVVTTIAGAGPGNNGYINATGVAARFSTPEAIAVDASGTLYVADTNNHRIRKVTSSGVVTLLAGSGTAGAADGTGAAAQFNTPKGIAVDSSGTVYVADTYSSRIRKISPAGVVTTLIDASNGLQAQFNSPEGVAVDTTGNLYVANTGDHRINKVTPAGDITILAGPSTSFGSGYMDGIGTAARFSVPQGLAIDSSGNVYVADTSNNRIRMITPSGAVTTLAGANNPSYNFADGPGDSALFPTPIDVTSTPDGTLFVTDVESGKQRIRKIAQ